MGFFSRLTTRRSTMLSVGGISVVSLTVATLAVMYPGYTTADVRLNDGGVWVTKPSGLLVGHLNYPAQVLDGGLRATSNSFDILQAGNTVLVRDAANATLTAIDPVTVSLLSEVTLPADSEVRMGAQTVAILDVASGNLYAEQVASVGSFVVESAEPVLELGDGAAVAVGTDGTIHAVSPTRGEIISIPVDAVGTVGEPVTASLAQAEPGELTITSVGSEVVVLDAAAGVLYLPGDRSVELDGDGAVLQQSGPESNSVLVATSTALITQPLDGGTAVQTDSGAAGTAGTATAPVYLAGCAYAVWSGSARYVRDCAGAADDVTREVEGVTAQAQLVFRVNRGVIVLNDLSGGDVWLLNQDMVKVNNWDDITPPPEDGDESDEDDSTEENLQNTLPERSEENTAPIAVDDDFGVRAGRSTVLPVLDNDQDADGDVLVARAATEDSTLGPIQAIAGGAALQIAVPADATGQVSVGYTIDDGRGGTDDAQLSITVRAPGTNGAPEQTRVSPILVEQGATVSYNLIPDWRDPDGDDLFLRNASATTDDEVIFSAGGVVTFSAIGQSTGRKEVQVTVSDGTEDSVGVLWVDVRPAGTLEPVANADHITAVVGRPVSVAPLSNDLSPSGIPLRLGKIDEVAGATVVADFAAGTFTFTGDIAQTYYLQYLVTDGPHTAVGLVRIDVQAANTEPLPPVAVRDQALLPAGRDVLVDVLANDIDPAGGVLVVQSVQVADGLGVSVAMLDHSVLRITDQAGLTSQVTIGYTVSNGAQSAQGEVLIVPVPAPEKLKPPVAVDDRVTVRAGDVVTIPVLDNDYHPNGDALSVAADLVAPLVDPADGEMFIAQNTLRFKAGSVAKTVYATYEVVDSAGQKDAGYVTIQILAVDAETNSPPRPQNLTARALAGTSVRIPIPLDGIDPDGDSVTLVGQADAPSKGRIDSIGQNWIMYAADPTAAGTDTFSYRVRDRLGAEATATILVGIAPTSTQNQRPYALKDAIVARPGRTIAVPVLANDTDPDGDLLTLVTDALEVPDGIQAKVSGDRVVITTPDAATDKTIQYTVSDSYGAVSIGSLQVTVTPEAPLEVPIARDDLVTAADIVDAATVDVPVLDNDEDPDGVASDLTVTVDDPALTVRAGGVIRATITTADQILTYSVVDGDGLTASAFIFVPGSGQVRPSLRADAPGIEVKSGERVQITLDDYVTVADGKSVRITEAAKVTAAHADGQSLVVDETTLEYTSVVGYFGPDSLSFEVTDGTGPDDATGLKAVLSLPITVIPPENQPPTFAGGTLQVAPGEGAATLDLRALTQDPDLGDVEKMRFSVIGAAPSGITVSVDGQTLSATAPSSTAKGTSGTVAIEVSDGTTAAIQGAVTISVTASTRPMPSTTDDSVPEAHQGDAAGVDVLANDFNPFPETPLEIVNAVVETGDGSASVSGTQVVVTPAADFVGTLVVRYRVADATGDADREVDGRIRLTVQGRPDAPSTPTVTSIQDKTVVLSWSPPSNNGAEITSYTVRSAQGFSTSCASTTCTLSGLTNDVEYTFTVIATNAVGDSESSPASAVARPDARPETPQPPTLVFGDKSLAVSWVTPPTPGSAVESYTLEISPAPAAGPLQKSGVTGNSLTWEGLENGVAYQVRVQAFNRAPDPSEFSSYSATMIPAGVPEAPATPTTARLEPVGSQAQLQVNWTAPANNGDAISGYTLNVLRGGAVLRTVAVAAGATSQSVVVDASTTDYTFTVAATNKAGTSAVSSPSAPRRGFVAPGAPTNVVASEGNNTVSVTYGPAAGNGATTSELSYEYSVNGGGWRSDWDGRTVGNGQVNNNGSYSIAVRAVTQLDGVRYDGAGSAPSNQVAPYGPPATPGASAQSNATSVTLRWSPPAPNGRAIDRLEISVDGGGWENVGAASGERTVGNGYSQGHSIQVRAVDAAGQTSGTASASASSGPQTEWTVTVDSAQSCAQSQLGTSEFSPGACNPPGRWLGANSNQTVTCWNTSATLHVNNDYTWLRLKDGYWVARRTLKAGQDNTIPAGMPHC